MRFLSLVEGVGRVVLPTTSALDVSTFKLEIIIEQIDVRSTEDALWLGKNS